MKTDTFHTPLYRAKITKSIKNEYAIGFLYSPTPSIFYILIERSGSLGLDNEIIIPENEYFEIDPTTLAVETKRKDLKEQKSVFEAINEHGKGGDIVKVRECDCLGRELDNIEERVAIQNDDWEKFHDYDIENDCEILEIKGIQS